MAKSWTISTLLLLCAVAASVKANVENTTQHHQPTTTSGHTGSETHPQQHSTTEPQGQQDEDDSGESEEISVMPGNSTDMNATNANRYNNTYRPNFRRYVDLKKNVAIVEKRVEDYWIRLRPPLADGEVQEANVTRYSYFPNGSRVALRSKFDYSYDDVNWFRSSRVKIPISQLPNGTTLYQFRFGPKRWISEYRNRAFRPNGNLSELNLHPGGPHHSSYRFDEEDAFFRPPRGSNVANGTARRKQVYKYGPVTDRNFGARRFGRPFYNNRYDYRPQYTYYDGRKWNQRGAYPDYYGPRPAYPPYAYNDPYYNDPRFRQGDLGYYDRRYRPAGAYDDPRYAAPSGAYYDRRYYSPPPPHPPPPPPPPVPYGDERYRSESYQSSARGYDDKRYYADGTYDDRKYQPQAAATYNEPTYRTYDTRSASDRTYDTRGASDRTYDTRGASDRTYDNRGASDRTYDTRGASDRTYDARGASDRATNYDDTRRYEQGYDDSYRRRDRRT